MKALLTLPFLAVLQITSLPALAECTTQSYLQPNKKFPIYLDGRLVYHTYFNYGDGSSKLFLKDFRNNTLTQLNQKHWNIDDPMNAYFSPDGRYLTFMGKQNARWNIFIWPIGSPFAPINLSRHDQTTLGSSEDAKFSRDGQYLVYKKDGDLMLGHLNFSASTISFDRTWYITHNAYITEESMPYFSDDGKTIYYSKGANRDSDIYKLNYSIAGSQLLVGQAEPVAAKPGLAEFYPSIYKNTLLYVGWTDANARKDFIQLATPSSTSTVLRLNDCNADNSDPEQVDDSYIFFSSTRTNPGYYNLYFGNINTGQVWSLNKFGINPTQKQQLGADYTTMR
jgi:Tol biopolymer transport system component